MNDKKLYEMMKYCLDVKRRSKKILDCLIGSFIAFLFTLIVCLDSVQGLAPSSAVKSIAQLKPFFRLNTEVSAEKNQPKIKIIGTRHNEHEDYLVQQIKLMIQLANLKSAIQFGYEAFNLCKLDINLFRIDNTLLSIYVGLLHGWYNLRVTEHKANARALLVYEML